MPALGAGIPESASSSSTGIDARGGRAHDDWRVGGTSMSLVGQDSASAETRRDLGRSLHRQSRLPVGEFFVRPGEE
jgi:hypothetical protein